MSRVSKSWQGIFTFLKVSISLWQSKILLTYLFLSNQDLFKLKAHLLFDI